MTTTTYQPLIIKRDVAGYAVAATQLIAHAGRPAPGTITFVADNREGDLIIIPPSKELNLKRWSKTAQCQAITGQIRLIDYTLSRLDDLLDRLTPGSMEHDLFGSVRMLAAPHLADGIAYYAFLGPENNLNLINVTGATTGKKLIRSKGFG